MDSRDMQIAFDVRLQAAGPDYEVDRKPDSHTIFQFINQSQEELIKTRYTGMNVKGESFEQTQKRTDDLNNLLTDAEITTVSATKTSYKPNGFMYDLPSDYMFRVHDEVKIELQDLNGTTLEINQGVTPCNSDTYTRVIENPYSEHKLHYETAKPLRLFYDNAVELVTDGNYDINAYYMRYIRKPLEIRLEDGSITEQNCELAEELHQEIVNKAVSLYLGYVKDQAYEASRMVVQEQE